MLLVYNFTSNALYDKHGQSPLFYTSELACYDDMFKGLGAQNFLKNDYNCEWFIKGFRMNAVMD